MLNFSFWLNRKDSRRPRRLRRRIPGHGQHRRVRPRQAAARRRPTRTERRHQLDGPLLHHDAHDRRRAGQERPDLPEHGDQVLRALPLHRPRDDEHGRGRHRFVGQPGRVLLRRDPAPLGPEHSAADSLDGRPGAAVRGVRRVAHQDARDSKIFSSGREWFVRASTRPVEECRPRVRARRERHQADVDPHQGSAHRRAAANARSRRSFSPTTASVRSRAITSTIRSSSIAAAASTPSNTCRPSPTAGCSAATRTGAGRSGSPSTTC